MPTFDNGESAASVRTKINDAINKVDGASPITSADINGGTIDGTVIGGSTPAAISGTTGQFGTSLNVDGTITSNGLVVEQNAPVTVTLSNTAAISSAGDPYASIDVLGDNSTGAGFADYGARFQVTHDPDLGTTTRGAAIRLWTGYSSLAALERVRISALGDVSFYEDTGTTPKFFWDASSESLGIGTTSPDSTLHVLAGAVAGFRIGYNGTSVNYYDADTQIFRQISGVESMRIDSSGNVGIGTTNTGYGKLGVYDATNGIIAVANSTSYAQLQQNGADLYINYNQAGAAGGNLIYRSYAGTERMRIDSSGNVLVGTTTPYSVSKATLEYSSNGAFGLALRDSGSATDGAMLYFIKGGSVVGSIVSTSSATAYNTSSDYRLKEDVQPMVGASDRLMSLKPVNFAWKADGSRTDGFLAHEAQEVVPQAVTGDKDGEEMQAIDHSKLVPLLTAALQEALQKIEALEARVAALEA